ncbi:MAG: hypothetical protein LC437_09175 [Thiohalomonas sp.]|nr:hypothetical protein [Thiohalomonas sp.]
MADINSELSELVHYKSRDDFLFKEQSQITDYYILFQDILNYKELSHRVLGIAGIYPVKSPKQVNSMQFVSVNTNKTIYAAL